MSLKFEYLIPMEGKAWHVFHDICLFRMTGDPTVSKFYAALFSVDQDVAWTMDVDIISHLGRDMHC